MTKTVFSVSLFLAIFSSSCWAADSASSDVPPSDGVTILDWDPSAINADMFVNKGWSIAQMNEWYNTSQGARFMPLTWFNALEVADSTEKFHSDSNFEKLQYIWTGGELPLGFVVDEWDKAIEHGTYSLPTTMTGAKWIGLTCAACHTGRIDVGGETRFIHGAPAMSDFMAFTNGVLFALRATIKDDEKFKRFATEILGENYAADSATELLAELEAFEIWRHRVFAKNGNVSHDEYGYGRLDAVGHIFNQVSLLVHQEVDILPDDLPEASIQWRSDAPVSYPHLWNEGQQALVQWNGVASNMKKKISGNDFAALGRNVGEVTGVFADVNVSESEALPDKLKLKLKSSAHVKNIMNLERSIDHLESPVWPTDLPGFEIDSALAATGKDLYKLHCENCHTTLAPDELDVWLPIGDQNDTQDNKIVMNWITDVGTDIWMACNADQFGVKRDKDSGDIIPGQPTYYQGAEMLTSVIKKTILSGENIKNIIEEIFHDTFAGGGSDESVPEIKALVSGPDVIVRTRHLRASKRKIDQEDTCIEKSAIAFNEKYQVQYTAAKAAYGEMGFFAKLFHPKKKKRLKAAEADAKAQLDTHKQLRYKARPLNGIWATAPYLHNGSVPTLADLMLPAEYEDPIRLWVPSQNPTGAAETRPSCFYTGKLDYDPAKAGYVSPSCAAPDSETAGLSKFDTSHPGNSNSGHNYPVEGLSADERKALLEFMKTL